MSSPQGLIFTIQRFSIHDGPGIRTTVFMKGCPLRCFWCHNPEGLQMKREVQFHAARCLGCGACSAACPSGAQLLLPDATRVYNRELCTTCGVCVDTCFSESLQMVGVYSSAAQVYEEVLRDRAFYETSGGGVTLSGGEPLLQPVFTRALLQVCRESGIHTAIETTTFCAWKHIEEVLPFTDLFMIDLKQLDSSRHRQATGVSNQRILANVERLAATGKPIIFRVPVIPTVNDTERDITAIAAFIRRLEGTHAAASRRSACPSQYKPLALELLPFHRLAGDKYTSLGLADRSAHLHSPTPQRMRELASAAEAQGVIVITK